MAGLLGDNDVMADLDWTPEFFLYEHPRPHVARITINRPEVRNAINTPAHKEWSDLLDHAAAERKASAVALTGWKGKKNGAWKANVGSGAATGVVKAGSQGRVIRATVKGLALDPGERVAWIRIELDGQARGAAVLLKPNKSGKSGKFKAQ